MKKIIFINLIALTTATCFSQTFEKEKLDNYIQALEKNDKFMGSVAISENGKLIYSKSIGFSNIETKYNQIKTQNTELVQFQKHSPVF